MYAVVKHSCYELCGYNAVVMNTVIETMLLCVLHESTILAQQLSASTVYCTVALMVLCQN